MSNINTKTSSGTEGRQKIGQSRGGNADNVIKLNSLSGQTIKGIRKIPAMSRSFMLNRIYVKRRAKVERAINVRVLFLFGLIKSFNINP